MLDLILSAAETLLEATEDVGDEIMNDSSAQIAESLSQDVSSFGGLVEQPVDLETATDLSESVRFGSGVEYYEGMHGRIDATYDGGNTWETIN